MTGTDYVCLREFLHEDGARVTLPPQAHTEAPRWRSGSLIELPPGTVFRYRIAVGEEGVLPPFVDASVPLLSEELLAALRSAGIDNLQLFDARIEEAATGQVHEGHKCVNVLGLLSVGALAKGAFDLSLFRSGEQAQHIVLHRRVRARIEATPVGARVDFGVLGGERR